jgi:glycine dehydrogenase subunit 2
MLTNPSTVGVFDRKILEMSKVVHAAGGLLYYDGANLNAILGKVRPGDMGFDVIHMNLHKTFSTPHGGRRPGLRRGRRQRAARAVPAGAVRRQGGERYRWVTKTSGRSPSAGCRPSWATPACCCAPTSTRACWAARACRGSPSSPR